MTTRTNVPPTAELRRQHRTIEVGMGVFARLVREAEGGAGVDGAGLRACLDFLRLYADKLHHIDEEELLFPILRRRMTAEGLLVLDGVEREHEEGRRLMATMYELLPAAEGGSEQGVRRFVHTARQYMALLLQHISKEDHLLFSIADRALTVRDRAKLTGAALAQRASMFEGRSREALEASLQRICATWGTKRQRRAAERKPKAPKVPGRKRGRPRKTAVAST
jgi:hemerythrin-like domain-containing protein